MYNEMMQLAGLVPTGNAMPLIQPPRLNPEDPMHQLMALSQDPNTVHPAIGQLAWNLKAQGSEVSTQEKLEYYRSTGEWMPGWGPEPGGKPLQQSPQDNAPRQTINQTEEQRYMQQRALEKARYLEEQRRKTQEEQQRKERIWRSVNG